jgi:peptide/nickel transport system substrate-binding protein
MARKKVLALVLALGMVAVACGSDDPGGTTEGAEGGGDGAQPSQITVEQIQGDSGIVGEVVKADPLPERGPEPTGTLDYAWHTAFSPAWFDPSQNTSSVSQFATQYILHDALVKGVPGRVLAPSLAEEYELAEDFLSARFKLREGLTFHDGSALTTEDVKFSYENYAGANAAPLKEGLDRIEVVDDLNITFHFKKPFLDFMTLYGTTATGAGWILPSDYYQSVGPEKFLEKPIGAGPFKFVENQNNTRIVYEANTDYWKKNPGVKTINWNAIADSATRFAAVQTGEIDLANVMPGDLIDAIRNDPNMELVPTTATSVWMEFPGYEDPANPFHDKRVREAVSLALDRNAINQAETGGGGGIEGQWVPEDMPGALQVTEPWEYNVDKAKQLMADAGFAGGFDVVNLTPLPPYFPLAERVITMLGEIGIRTQLNQMDRGAFLAEINAGKAGKLGGIIINISGAGGDAFSRIRNFATCNGSASRICDPKIDEAVAAYDASIDPEERQEISDEVQQYMIDEMIFPYVYDLGLNMVQGPDVVEPPSKVWAQIPQYVYPGLWEDIHVKA